MYEFVIGYKCNNGEIIKVIGNGFSKEKALLKAINKLKTYPYFIENEFNGNNLIIN